MERVSELIERLCRQGLLVSGSFATQHYLPASAHASRHEDIDFIIQGWNFRTGKQRLFRELKKAVSELGEFEQLPVEQPRREVWETRAYTGKGEPVYIHMEFTDIPVKSQMTRLNNTHFERAPIARIPDLNYLIARTLFAIGSPTRPWSRKLEDIANLAEIYQYNHSRIKKVQVLELLRKIAGGKAEMKKTREVIHQVLSQHIEKFELEQRRERTRVGAQPMAFNALETLIRIRQTFGRPSEHTDPRIGVAQRMYRLPLGEKQALAQGIGVKSEPLLWRAIEQGTRSQSNPQLGQTASSKGRKFLKRVRKLTTPR